MINFQLQNEIRAGKTVEKHYAPKVFSIQEPNKRFMNHNAQVHQKKIASSD